MSKLYETWDALLFIQCAVMIVGNVFYTWFIQNDTFTTPLKCKNFYMTCILVILYITMIHNSARGHYFLKKKIDIYYHKIRIFRGLNTWTTTEYYVEFVIPISYTKRLTLTFLHGFCWKTGHYMITWKWNKLSPFQFLLIRNNPLMHINFGLWRH